MIPFDEHWIHQIGKQYGSKHQWEQPDVYRIATNTNMSATRTLVNHFVDALPDIAQAKLVPKLRKDTSFSDAFHEIVVGAMLTACGPIPDYEPKLTAEKTPDWYVAPRGEEIACVIEVASCNPPDGRRNNSLEELVLRLEEIPCQVVLDVAFTSGNANLLADTPKQIASDVQKWLELTGAAPRSTMQRGGITFTVLSSRSDSGTIEVILDPDAFWVNSNHLRRLITDKAKKYTDMCQKNGMAFVIAVVVDPVTGLGTDNLKSVLSGTLRCPIAFDKARQHPLLKQPYRFHDGVFEDYPGLNAVAWIAQNEPNAWTSTLYLNPVCNVPLPEQVLKGLQSTR